MSDEEERSDPADKILRNYRFLPSEVQADISRVLATLSPREEKILRMRYGVGERSDHTLEEVGEFSMERERRRQIETTAMDMLRVAREKKKGKPR